MNLRKKISFLVFGLILVFSGMFSTPVFAQDADIGSKTIGGVKVSYTNVLTYTDTRCGVNTRAHYKGNAAKSISNMKVNWNIKNGAGRVLESSGISKNNAKTISDKSKDRQPITVSTGNFSFKNGGTTWTPTSRAYHCVRLKSISNEDNENNIEVTSENEENIIKLKQLYSEIKTNGNSRISNLDFSNEDIKEIVKSELTDNATDLTVYQDENGKTINLDDFEIISVKAGNSVSPVVDDVTFSNPNADNTTIIEVEIPKTVYENGEELKVTGYVVLIDGNGQNLESGISVEPL